MAGLDSRHAQLHQVIDGGGMGEARECPADSFWNVRMRLCKAPNMQFVDDRIRPGPPRWQPIFRRPGLIAIAFGMLGALSVASKLRSASDTPCR